MFSRFYCYEKPGYWVAEAHDTFQKSMNAPTKLNKPHLFYATHQQCYEQPNININITMNGAITYPIDLKIIRKTTESIPLSIR
ncbi:hypothetical protein W01_19140 [Candidatus Nitrotoga sp. AM1P]|nr:hypothetical protein W01_19140 [Candidatus Nitrotoga sp. AM1P]